MKLCIFDKYGNPLKNWSWRPVPYLEEILGCSTAFVTGYSSYNSKNPEKIVLLRSSSGENSSGEREGFRKGIRSVCLAWSRGTGKGKPRARRKCTCTYGGRLTFWFNLVLPKSRTHLIGCRVNKQGW